VTTPTIIIIIIEEQRHTEKDECPFAVEIWVFQERCKEVPRKFRSKSDIGVMTVVCYVETGETQKRHKGEKSKKSLLMLGVMKNH